MFLRGFKNICEHFGKEIDGKYPKFGGVSLVQYQSESESANVYFCFNRTRRAVKIEFDLTGMKNANYTHPLRTVVKILFFMTKGALGR